MNEMNLGNAYGYSYVIPSHPMSTKESSYNRQNFKLLKICCRPSKTS